MSGSDLASQLRHQNRVLARTSAPLMAVMIAELVGGPMGHDWGWVGFVVTLAAIEVLGWRVSRNGNTPLHLLEVLTAAAPNREIDAGRALKVLTAAAWICALGTAWWQAGGWIGAGFMAFFLRIWWHVAAISWRWPTREAAADPSTDFDAWSRRIGDLRAQRDQARTTSDAVDVVEPAGDRRHVATRVGLLGATLALVLLVGVWMDGWTLGLFLTGVVAAGFATTVIGERIERKRTALEASGDAD